MALQEAVVSLVQGNNLLLFILLIALFIVAYRVLKIVINTAIVAVLSGAFLVLLDFVGLGPEATINRFMMFMVLGTGLFILFSAVQTLVRTTSGVIGAIKKMFSWLSGSSNGKEQKEKEIVLEELKDD
ncbi:MAG: hypothetical protein SVS85_01065 [Candidatus Nanohaloarchaea archaeon]|nr:hypothetical protein [Candidatus Nanohaloarchaea archaeon]